MACYNYSTKKTSTLEEEILSNPFFHFTDLDRFIKLWDIIDKENFKEEENQLACYNILLKKICG